MLSIMVQLSEWVNDALGMAGWVATIHRQNKVIVSELAGAVK
jgi:hypothetical protein